MGSMSLGVHAKINSSRIRKHNTGTKQRNNVDTGPWDITLSQTSLKLWLNYFMKFSIQQLYTIATKGPLA
jgi:hypothetical protein